MIATSTKNIQNNISTILVNMARDLYLSMLCCAGPVCADPGYWVAEEGEESVDGNTLE